MMQPATARLGKTKTGMEIGYRLLNLERKPSKPFTRQGVTETGIPGTYAALVDAPASGGFIVWGTADQDIAEAAIEPEAPETPDIMPAIRQALDLLMQNIAATMPKTPVIQMDTQPFEQGVSELQQTVGDQVTEIYGQLKTLRDSVDHLQILNDAANYQQTILAFHSKVVELFGEQAPIVRMVTDNSSSELTSILEMVRGDVERLGKTVDSIEVEKASKDRFRKAYEAWGKVEKQLEIEEQLRGKR